MKKPRSLIGATKLVAEVLKETMEAYGYEPYMGIQENEPRKGRNIVYMEEPTNWASLFGSGDSLLVEDHGYGIEPEPKIQELTKLLREAGYGWEAETGHRLSIFKD